MSQSREAYVQVLSKRDVLHFHSENLASESTLEIPMGREPGTARGSVGWGVELETLSWLLWSAYPAQSWSNKLLLDREREKVKWKNLDVEVVLDLCSNPRFNLVQFGCGGLKWWLKAKL